MHGDCSVLFSRRLHKLRCVLQGLSCMVVHFFRAVWNYTVVRHSSTRFADPRWRLESSARQQRRKGGRRCCIGKAQTALLEANHGASIYEVAPYGNTL